MRQCDLRNTRESNAHRLPTGWRAVWNGWIPVTRRYVLLSFLVGAAVAVGAVVLAGMLVR